MIILEGPDGHGKSTLAEKLQQEFDASIWTSGSPPKDTADIVMRAKAVESYAASGERLIIDRCPAISELVYGNVVRGDVQLPHAWRYIFKLVNYEVIFIYCKTTDPIHSPKMGENPKHLAKINFHEEAIIKAYDDIFSDILCLEYDWRTNNIEDLFAWVHNQWR